MEKGFFGSLFDLSFTSFVTPKLVKILFIISLVLLGIAYIFIAISIFSSGGETTFNASTGEFEESGGNAALGILWLLILGPLFLFFYKLLYRVFFGFQIQTGDPHMGATIATVMFLIILVGVMVYLLGIQRRMTRYQF